LRFKKRDPKEVGIAIEAYIKQITTCTEPLAIYLFGSLARGEGSIESDIDLLIIYSHQAEARAAQKTILREPSPYPIPADLICIDRDSWDGIHRYSHLVDLVKEEGKLVFASSDWLAERSGLNESPQRTDL
jgi:hypothetical protein